MIDLRGARSTDAGTVGGILSDFVKGTAWMPQVHTQAQDIAHAGQMIARGWVRVAVKARDVIGFSASDGVELNALYVAKEAQGCGVGRLLLKQLQSDQTQIRLWTFQANTQAQRFYLREGFREVSRSDGAQSDEKLPDVRFEWHAVWQRESV